MKTIQRKDLPSDYDEMMVTETHHDHEIIMDSHGIIRWKENIIINHILINISLNDLCPLLDTLGYGKNSEVYRKLYRDMGFSLSSYGDVFYCSSNNEERDDYKQPTIG